MIAGLFIALVLSGPSLALPQPLLRLPVTDDNTAIIQKNWENIEWERRRLYNGNATLSLKALTVGGTSVSTGAASSTDNAIVRFDGTSGKILQNSGVIIDDSNNITIPGQIIQTGASECRWTDTTTINSGATTILTANTQQYDNLNELATTGIFTATQTGKYLCQANTSSNGWTSGGSENIYIYVNGIAYPGSTNTVTHTGDGRITNLTISDVVSCPAGQTIDFRVSHSKATAVTFTTFASIRRVP